MDTSDVTKLKARLWRNRFVFFAASIAILLVLAVVVLAIPYYRLARRVDRQFERTLLNTVDYYSASEIIAPGDPMSPADLAASLKRVGYSFTQNDHGIVISSRPACTNRIR